MIDLLKSVESMVLRLLLFVNRVELAKVNAVGKVGAEFQLALVLQLLSAPPPVQVDCAGELAGASTAPLASRDKASEEMILRGERRRTARIVVMALIGLTSRGSGFSEVSLHGAFIGFGFHRVFCLVFGEELFRKIF